MDHTCKYCRQTKPETDFYKQSRVKCKDCTIAAVTARAEANPGKIKEYEKTRSNFPHRVSARRAYAETEHGKERLLAGRLAWQKRNPEKRTAHNILNAAVRDSKVIKPKRCGRCGAGGRIHAHHPNYVQPLAVEWLCSACHRDTHKDHSGV